MKKKTVVLFFLVFITFCQQGTPFADAYNPKCLGEMKKEYQQVKTFGQNCYFVVNGAIDKTNEYVFRMDIAREICKNESATLPIIKNHGEDEFVARQYHNKQANDIVLGLQQNRSKHRNTWFTLEDYEWDDGSNLTYTNVHWYFKDYAYVTVMNPPWHHQPVLWYNEPNSRVSSRTGVNVVCQKTYKPTSTSTALTSASTVESTSQLETTSKRISRIKCHQPDSSIFSKTAIFEELQICYFIVKQATKASNFDHMGWQRFNHEKARKICNKHNATLPIVWSRDEAKFILDNFKPIHYDSTPIVGVVLGLSPSLEEGKEHPHVWDDGNHNFYYEPDVWNPEDTEGGSKTGVSFVVMHFDKDQTTIVWQSISYTAEVPKLVGVLCQQNMQPRVPPQIPTPSSAIKCKEPNSKIYSKPTIFGDNKICYFIVKKATERSNGYKFGFADYYKFNKDIARSICMKHNATLPSVWTRDEAIFISKTYKTNDFGSVPVAGVALGMTLMTSDGGDEPISQYHWDDGGSLEFYYEPDIWNDKKIGNPKLVFMDFMTRNKNAVEWTSMAAEIELVKPIGVLCQQIIEKRTPPAAKKKPLHSTADNNKMAMIFVALAAMASYAAK